MRIGVIGLGSIGSRHARNLIALGHEVLGYDPREAGPDELWDRGPTPQAVVLGSAAVVVASPSSLHADHALLALEHRRPVLVEKPLAVAPEDARKIAARAAREGVTCGVAMNLRFHPATRALRALLSDGELGQIRVARVWCGSDLRSWRPGSDYRESYSARSELGGGVVRDCIHELDYITWLLGPCVSVTAETATVSDLEIDVEDVGLALLRLRSGVLVSVELSYVDPVYRRGCLLIGERASAEWDWNQGTITVSEPGRPVKTLDVAADVADTYIAELEDFIAAVERSGDPRTAAIEGAGTAELAAALLQASAEGRRISL